MRKILVLFAFSVTGYTSFAQAGTPDPAFGSNGVVTTTFGAGQAGSKSMALQSDGKIVMAGYINNGSVVNFAVARYNTNGTPDNSFDGDGKLTTIFSGSIESSANAVAIQADGKIVVAGYSHAGITDVFALVRYNINGSLDDSFSGDGKVTTSIGLSNSVAYSVVIQADGKIILAGSSDNGTNLDFALVRYNTDGTLDNSFDTDGIVTTSLSSADDIVYSIALQTDGKIVVAGNSNDNTRDDTDFALARYGTDGSLDNSFDTDGIVIIPAGDVFKADLAIQADGKMVVAGGNINGIVLTRYNSNGSPDNTFGGDGIVTTPIGSQSEATSVAIQPDGKIVVAGDAITGPLWDFAIARYNSNGSLDNTFDNDGIVTKNVNGDDFGNAMKIAGQRIYVGGVSNRIVFTLVAFQTGPIILPLQLISFNAYNQSDKNILHWQTATEQNTAWFTIEHSKNGISFSKIGEVQAAGNSSAVKDYSFTDMLAAPGNNYYRLIMIDADGRFTYSKVLLVKSNITTAIEIFPNPAQDVLQVQVMSSAGVHTELRIQDVAGKIIKRQTITAGRSLSTLIDISALANGVYFLVVSNKNGMTVSKFIKK